MTFNEKILKHWYQRTMGYLSANKRCTPGIYNSTNKLQRQYPKLREPVSMLHLQIFQGKAEQLWWREGYWLPEFSWEEALTAKRDFFGWNYFVTWLCCLLHRSTDVLKLRKMHFIVCESLKANTVIEFFLLFKRQRNLKNVFYATSSSTITAPKLDIMPIIFWLLYNPLHTSTSDSVKRRKNPHINHLHWQKV